MKKIKDRGKHLLHCGSHIIRQAVSGEKTAPTGSNASPRTLCLGPWAFFGQYKITLPGRGVNVK